MRRLRLLAAAAATATLVGVAALPGTADAGAVTLPSLPRPGSTMGPTLTIATQRYPAGMRFVTATVHAARVSRSTARELMLAIVLTCGGESIPAGTNIMGTGTVVARRAFRDARLCRVTATSAVGKKPVDALQVSTTFSARPLSFAYVGYQPDGWPTLLTPGQEVTAAPVTATLPAGTRTARVQGDAKVTTCISVSGSRENGSDNLCAADRLNPAGTMLTVAVVAAQLDEAGQTCAGVVVASRTVHADRWTHHVMIPQSGTLTLSTAAGCTSRVQLWLHVQVRSGADLVVSRQATITTLYD